MDKKTIQKNMVRHGEVLLIPVDELPENVEQIFEGAKYIVAHSETGHNHVAIGTAKNAFTVYKPIGADSQDIYLRVNSVSKLEHQKTFDRHDTKTLNEGVYLVRPKTEYDPFEKLIRQVQD
jgi:hypothetical protein